MNVLRLTDVVGLHIRGLRHAGRKHEIDDDSGVLLSLANPPPEDKQSTSGANSHCSGCLTWVES